MKLDHVSAVIRPRSHWEAIDLGFKLARAHYVLMLKASITLTLPPFLLIWLLFMDAPYMAGLIFWWLEPIWERSHFFVLSRCLFGEPPTVRETVREFRHYAQPAIVLWLTIWRLRPTRILDMPVTQLEGLTGKARSERLRVLRRGTAASGAIWLLIVVAHMEIFLVLSMVMVGVTLVPPTVDFDLASWVFGLDDAAGPLAGLVSGLLSYASIVLLAPFFVGGGFGLYINRRTILEGWDLEIAFRRLEDRLAATGRRASAPANSSRSIASALLIALTAGTLMASAPLQAAAGATSSALDPEGILLADPLDLEHSAADIGSLDPQAARVAIEAILEGDAFHNKDTIYVPQLVEALRGEPSEDDSWLVEALRTLLDWLELGRPEKSDPNPLFDWLSDALEAIAVSAEVLLIAAALAVLVFIVYRSRANIADFARRTGLDTRVTRSRPRVLMGMDVSPESLPHDVVGSVRALFASGDFRASIALLYRASLFGLMEQHGTRLQASMTERDCVRAAAESAQTACAAYFEGLTKHWQLVAYAHRTPSEHAVDALCLEWPRFFGDSEPHESSSESDRTGARDDG